LNAHLRLLTFVTLVLKNIDTYVFDVYIGMLRQTNNVSEKLAHRNTIRLTKKAFIHVPLYSSGCTDIMVINRRPIVIMPVVKAAIMYSRMIKKSKAVNTPPKLVSSQSNMLSKRP
jgi:hypothetical protein